MKIFENTQGLFGELRIVSEDGISLFSLTVVRLVFLSKLRVKFSHIPKFSPYDFNCQIT